MLGIILTFLFPVYLVGPDLLSRLVLGIVVPRRVIIQTRSEEITRGALWALIPLWLAYLWARPIIGKTGGLTACRDFFLGSFTVITPDRSSSFISSTKAVFWINFAIIWRLYSIVFLAAAVVAMMIWKYHWVRGCIKNQRLRDLLALLVLPRIAEWHVQLSGMLADPKPITTYADVMSKVGVLYKGTVHRYTLTSTGDLASLTLQNAHRYRRERYNLDLEAKGADGAAKAVNKEDYWAEIPGNLFTILASDISTINVRHVVGKVEENDKRIRELIEELVQEARTQGPHNIH